MTCQHCGTDHHEDDLRTCRDVIEQQRNAIFCRNAALERQDANIIQGRLDRATEKLEWLGGRHTQLMGSYTRAIAQHGQEVARLTGEVARVTAMLAEAPEYVGLPESHETRRLRP